VIRIYDEVGNVMARHEHAGDSKSGERYKRETKSRHSMSVTVDCEMLLLVRPADGRSRCDILSHAANHFQIARRHYAHRHHRIRVGGRG